MADGTPLSFLLQAVETSKIAYDGEEEQVTSLDSTAEHSLKISFYSTSGRNRPREPCAVPSVRHENPLYKSVTIRFELSDSATTSIPVKVDASPQDNSSMSKLWLIDEHEDEKGNKSKSAPSHSSNFLLSSGSNFHTLILRPQYVSRRNSNNSGGNSPPQGRDSTKARCTRFQVTVQLSNTQVFNWTFRLYCPRYGARLPRMRQCMFNDVPSEYLINYLAASDSWRFRVDSTSTSEFPSSLTPPERDASDKSSTEDSDSSQPSSQEDVHRVPEEIKPEFSRQVGSKCSRDFSEQSAGKRHCGASLLCAEKQFEVGLVSTEKLKAEEEPAAHFDVRRSFEARIVPTNQRSNGW